MSSRVINVLLSYGHIIRYGYSIPVAVWLIRESNP
jgi:hypothetical protein